MTSLITVLLDIWQLELVSFARAIQCIGLWQGQSAGQKATEKLQDSVYCQHFSLQTPALQRSLRVATDVHHHHHSSQGEEWRHLGKQMLSISESAIYVLISRRWQVAYTGHKVFFFTVGVKWPCQYPSVKSRVEVSLALEYGTCQTARPHWASDMLSSSRVPNSILKLDQSHRNPISLQSQCHFPPVIAPDILMHLDNVH